MTNERDKRKGVGKMVAIVVERTYLPEVQGTPGYGVSWRGSTLTVHLSDKVPSSVCWALASHLEQKLLTAEADEQTAWALTRDFLVTHRLAGYLRKDNFAQEWRWFGGAT